MPRSTPSRDIVGAVETLLTSYAQASPKSLTPALSTPKMFKGADLSSIDVAREDEDDNNDEHDSVDGDGEYDKVKLQWSAARKN